MAANTEVTSSVKTVPVMRRLHYLQTKRTLMVAVGLTAVVTVAFRLLYNNPRKAAYAEFYKNYDADKSFERMRSKGLFQSC